MRNIITVLFFIFYFTTHAQISECEKLNEAIIQGNQTEFKRILSKNIDVNCSTKYGGVPLGTACAYGNKEFVKLLLQKKSNPNIFQFYNGKSLGTPLFDALSICSQQLEPKLIDPVKIKLTKKGTKKEECNKKIKNDIAKILIENGADVLAINEDNTTTLMMASMYGRCKILTLLLNKGVNINARNNYGNTALIYAANNNDYTSVNILILAGADVLIKNNEGKTALDIANENKFEKIKKLLSSK